MLTGQAATMQCLSLASNISFQVTPADLDGQQKPPQGNPEYFIGLNEPLNLLIFKFHVDFTNPLNTNVTTFSLPVKNFTKACPSTGGTNCVIQPNTNTLLNLQNDIVQKRIPYRQYAPYGSMVLSHNVQGPSPELAPAIRWYELRVYRHGSKSADFSEHKT